MEMGALAVAPPIHIHTHLRWRWRSLPDIFNQIYQILFSEITHAFLLPVSVHSIGDTDTVTARVDIQQENVSSCYLQLCVCVHMSTFISIRQPPHPSTLASL